MISAIHNGDIFDGEQLIQEQAVVLENGLVHSLVPEAEIPAEIQHRFDLRGGTLVPGFIDLQVNGGGGVLFNNEPTVDAIKRIAVAHRKFGTTSLLPTLITDDFAVMRKAVEAVKQALDEGVPGIIGIHLEGPFLNAEKKGAHDADKFCLIDDQGLDIISSLGEGKTLITIAPELTTPEMIRRIRAKGVIVSIGHSAASFDETQTALAAGVTGFTHLFNAMTPLQSRAPGMVGAALSDNDSWFGIIADGHHVHPASVKVAVSAKRRGGAVLVTDAMPTVGSDQGFFELNNEVITVRDGRCVNAAGSLAGSDLDMITAITNTEKFAEVDLYEAVRMASVYPALAIGVDDQLGYIRKGYKANFVALDSSRNVISTWVDGQKE